MTTETACPSISDVEALRDGELTEREAASLRAHVEHCHACLVKVARVFRQERERLRPGVVLEGRFELTQIIGRGGMGTIWEAKVDSGELVAIKVLRTADPEHVRRLVQREARLGLRLQDAGFVRVRELLTLKGGLPALVMERLFGCSLAEHIAQHAPLGARETVGILQPLSAALAVLHGHKVAHRDLAPKNVFLETPAADGGLRVRILDFGLSRSLDRERGTQSAQTITRAGVIFGTPHFVAPEQLTGAGNIGTAADVWALGTIAHVMLSGQPYVEAVSLEEASLILLRRTTPDLSRLPQDIPEPLRELIASSLQLEPGKRPGAANWCERLTQLMAHHTLTDS